MLENYNAKNIWSGALGYLEMVVQESVFKTWLKNTRGLAIEKELLIVSVESIFAIEMLSQRLEDSINDALLQTIGKKFSIKYVLSTHKIEQSSKLDAGKIKGSWINPKFNFDTFITGSSNYLAFAAAKKVCESPGALYNPLYIYGEWGLGKTHLIQAIAKTLKIKGLNIVSVTGESYTNDFVKSVKNNNLNELKKYRDCDIFIIDDIDFFSGKKQTVESLIHIINQLQLSEKQVIVTSYNHPNKINMSTRLTSILKSGLIVKIQTPDKETSKKYILKKFNDNFRNFDEKLVDFIASKKFTSFSEIEGIIKSLVAHSELLNKNISEEMVINIIQDYKLENIKDINISIEKIFSLVKYMFGIDELDLKSRKNDKKTNYARHFAAYLLIEKSNFSTSQAGKLLGNRNHSTIIYSVNKMKNELSKNVQLKAEIEKSILQN
jgi:chromosomal replication initiator protein